MSNKSLNTLDLPHSEWTDEELLLEYRSTGDRKTFNQLFHRYEGELLGYLRNYLGDAHKADDVYQQTFLQIHLKCDTFEPGRKVRPWLYTVATNQAIDSIRRNKRHVMVSLDKSAGNTYSAYGHDESASVGEMLDDSGKEPGENVEEDETRLEVRDAVDGLPEPVRQVVVLVYFQGLKYREAAEILDIPVGTIKSRLHAAIKILGRNPSIINTQEHVSEKVEKTLKAA